MLGLFSSYFLWHYGRALSDIWNHIRNFLWFLYNFFSISLLSKTLFAPWQRLEEHYVGGLHPGDMGAVILTNLIMRAVGFFIRLFVIILGFLALIAAILFAVIFFIIWLLLPLIAVMFLILSFRLISS